MIERLEQIMLLLQVAVEEFSWRFLALHVSPTVTIVAYFALSALLILLVWTHGRRWG